MKRKIKYFLMLFISIIICYSCSEDYLDVADPTVLSEALFPETVDDLEPILVDLYGRLQDGYFSNYFRHHILLSHSNDHGYNGAEFNESALNILNPDMSYVKAMWSEPYLAIGKCNGFLITLDEFRASGELTDSESETINQMEGQTKFIRALNYFYLVSLYGEAPILTEADKDKMGVPLWTDVPDQIESTSRERATQGEVWDQVISDLIDANDLLTGVVFDSKARVDEWAVKSLLGKAYIHTLQWSKAKQILKEVIDNSGKELMSYDFMRNKMFHGNYEFSDESIFEVNYTPDPLDQNYGGTTNTGTYYPVFVSVTWIDDDGNENTNGFGNLFVHDETMKRYGFNDTTTVNQKRPDYIAKSIQVREDKSVDPRLFVSTFQPYVDSVYYEGQWRMVGKNRMESYNSTNKKGWCNGKYNVIDEYWLKQFFSKMNFYVLRLADVYLLYAEALINMGEETEGLEYINKVHRRAYDQPINEPSVYDYSSLSDRTMTAESSDPLANDPLKYERWAELFAEGNWWLDVRRFDLGAEETAYYDNVMGGTLEWDDYKYAFPIPTAEINSNGQIIQNDGY